EMGAGEASFDVAHDAARPFEVAIGDRRIHVLGTEFNVLNLPGRVAVTVRRGVVSVSDAKGEVARLLPGEQLVFANGGVVRRGGAAEAAFAWQYGRLIYSDVSLQELAADLNRYYTPPVRVEPSAAALRFSGVLALDGQERVIHRLEAFMPIDAAPGANGGYLLRARAD
ncbi:MAG: FecR family protein, partial [Hyphomonadaceae bacterium]